MKLRIIVLCSILVCASVFGQQKEIYKPSKKVKSKDWAALLDDDLSQWEVWTGVPHKSVQNLPKGIMGVDNVMKQGRPIGLGDPMGIYQIEKDKAGDPIVHISGEIYAGLTTKKDYENYHLTLLFKWGEKKHEPRLNQKRDNGLLYHCYGNHGAFWKVWKRCLELQIQEEDFGDLYTLAGTKATTKVVKAADGKNRWSKNGKPSKGGKRGLDAESAPGKWTRVDLYTVGDKAIHVVNGKVVLAIYDAENHEGKALTSGQIQIQSEGAEGYIKDVAIRPIKKFPRKIRRAAGF